MDKHVGSKLDDFLDEEGLLAECEAMAKSLLRSVHETAKGLHKSGVMDELTMSEFDALCLPPDASTAEVKGLTREQIQALRNRVDDELK